PRVGPDGVRAVREAARAGPLRLPVGVRAAGAAGAIASLPARWNSSWWETRSPVGCARATRFARARQRRGPDRSRAGLERTDGGTRATAALVQAAALRPQVRAADARARSCAALARRVAGVEAGDARGDDHDGSQ